MKIRIKDTPQAYKDIVKFHSDNKWRIDSEKLTMIGKTYREFYEPVQIHNEFLKDTYMIENCYFPKSACEIIEDERPNYLEQAKKHFEECRIDIDVRTRMTLDLILKHLESKEVG